MARIFFDRARYAEEATALESLPTADGTCIVGIDLAAPAEGLAEMIAARRAGMVTAVFPILAHPLEYLYAQIGQSIAAASDDFQRNQQIAAFAADQLVVNGRKPAELASHSQAHVNAAALALRLADVVLLGAPGERERWNSMAGRPLRRFSVLPIVSDDHARFNEAGVTIYAPFIEEKLLTHYVLMLRRRGIEPAVISADRARDPVATRVVIAPEWRPMPARYLAARGHHVVAPNVCRVDECDTRIFSFTPSEYRSLGGAVDAALASQGGCVLTPAQTQIAAEIDGQRPCFIDGPCVSILVRTFNRPTLLRRAIESIAKQSYRNVEIVVVNNGGADVHDIVKSAARGRPYKYEMLSNGTRVGAALNIAARAGSGEYVGYLDDDDILYADHCARTVEVLERTRADVAFTLCLGEYAHVQGSAKTVVGYQIYIDRDYDLDELNVSNLTPIHSIVHRRDIFDRFGYFDGELPVTEDWEMWLRVASRGGTFLRVDHATCEYSWRYDPERGNMTIDRQWDFVRAYRTITERYATYVNNRGDMKTAQDHALLQQERRAKAADDPSQRAAVVIGTMSPSLVPVAIVRG